MASNNVVIVYDQLQSAVTKLENYYTMLEEQQKMISRLDTYFDHLYKIHGKGTTFVATMEDKIQSMAAAVKNDMADIDYLKNLINYIIQSYTDAEGQVTLRSNQLLLSALGSLVPTTAGLTTSIYQNLSDYSSATQLDPSKVADISQYSDVKNWRTYASTNAKTADAWDAVHDNSSTNGEKHSYKISSTGSKISTQAENVAVQDTQKDVEEAEQKVKEAEQRQAEAEKAAEAAEQRAQEAEEKAKEAEAKVKEAEKETKKPENTYTETEQTERKSSSGSEAPVTKKPAAKTQEPKTSEPKTPDSPVDPEEPDTPTTPVEPEPIGPDVDPDSPSGDDELPVPETKKSSGGNKVVPIIAGVAAAGAAGVGAKIFLDKKTGSNIDDENWEESDEYNEYGDSDISSSSEDNVLDSSDEFTYKADLDEDYSAEDYDEDNFSDVSEEEEVQGYQAINFNDISETH